MLQERVLGSGIDTTWTQRLLELLLSEWNAEDVRWGELAIPLKATDTEDTLYKSYELKSRVTARNEPRIFNTA